MKKTKIFFNSQFFGADPRRSDAKNVFKHFCERFILSEIFVVLIFCLFQFKTAGQTKTSVSSGNWGSASTWSPSGVPTVTNDVIIANGHILDMNINGACNSLTIGQGLAAVLAFNNGGVVRTLSITTNLTINSGATFSVQTNSNKTHTIVITGNVVNNGVLNFASDFNSFVHLSFSKNGNQSISGSGTTTNFKSIGLDMGTSINNILDVTSLSFTADSNFLRLSTGTFKLSTPNPVSVIAYTNTATIPVTGAIWLNSANAKISAYNSITLNGNIAVTNGTLSIGDAANEDLLLDGGTLTQSNGVINIAGKYNTSGAASTYSIGGGTFNVPTISSTNTLIAPFHISVAGSSFNMTGGSINIIREGGSGVQNLGFINTGALAGTVTGGTLQIGTAATPAAQIMSINSAYSIANLNLGSANATASLVTNALNVIKNVTISSGILNANNLNITLGGNWTNNGGTYTPGTNTTIFNSVTAQSIFKTGGETFNNITFSGAGVKTFSSAVITNSNVLVNSGASVDVNSPSNQLSIKFNYTNNGSINTRTGTILFNGTTAQTIGGTTVTDFHNLTINNTSTGVSLLSAQNLINTLTLSNGVFSTNSQAFTMVSTATMTARIAQIAGTGDISGNVIVQRFAPGGFTGWAFFGTPISSALTLNDWDDDIFISCPTCPDGSASGFLSIYSYDETVAGSYSAAAAYIPLNTINDPIIPNKGYWVYLGTSSVTTTNITIDVTGTVRKFGNTIPINYTNYGSTIDDGWNLIHNPYPSPIRWSLLKGATTGIDNAIYVFNADLSAGTGAYASYVNNVSSPAVGSGGVGDTIPMSQGFYVHSTGATALNAAESNKVGGNPAYLKINPNTQAAASITPLLRLHLKNSGGYDDETVLYFQPGATDYFDAGFDAYKLGGQDPYAPVISLVKGDEFQINGINPISGNFTMPLKTVTGYSGTYTISAENISSFPTGACISLYDKFTNTTTDLKANDYVFTLADTTTVPRFDLNISLNPLNINSTTNQPSCPLPNSGEITAVGVNTGPWNYYWKDATGTIIKTSLTKATADTLNGLSGSTYTVEVNTVGMCDDNTTGFVINAVTLTTAQFTSQDTTDISLGALVNFTNTSINSTSDYWDFGDAIGFSTATSPNYNYLSGGTFTAMLITTSGTGCTDTTSKTITVITGLSTNISALENSSALLVLTLNENDYLIQQKLNDITDLNFKLYDVSGRVIIDYGDMRSDKINLSVNLKNYNQGLYFLRILANNKLTTIKLPAK